MNLKWTILLLLFGSLQGGFSQTEEVQTQIDSLSGVVQSEAHDTTRLKALHEWDDLIYLFDPQQDLLLNEQIAEICERNLALPNLTSREYQIYGASITTSYNNLGLIQTGFGDYAGAVQSYYKCVEYAGMRRDSLMMAKAYINLGLNYQRQNLAEKAIKSFNRSREIAPEDSVIISTYYMNVGVSYTQLKELDSAIVSFQRAQDYLGENPDPRTVGNLYANLGDISYTQEKYDSAVHYYEKAKAVYTAISDIEGIAFAFASESHALSQQGKTSEAIDSALYGLKLAKECEVKVVIQLALESCVLAYEAINDHKTALKYFRELHEMKTSNISAETFEKAANFESLFRFEKMRFADSLNHKNDLKIQELSYESTLKNERNFRYFLYSGSTLLLALLFISVRSFRRKKRDNELISQQKWEVETQREELAEKNKEITDSISYAKRIQDALLPSNERRRQLLPSSFLIYLPKDIVAGDFYWLEEKDELLLFAVADCTGHGVPGAMVSVICHNSLNRCVREFGLTDPGRILTKCRELVIEHFTESNEQVKDGMDIALCCWNRSNNQMKYSGAHNSLYLAREGELSEFNGNKQPVGYFENATEFKTEVLEVKQGDRIYLSSDGFPDQFGGEKGKKFKYKPFKQLLLSSSTESTERQREIISDTFTNWKGNYEQLDDVCIIGIEV